MSIEQMGSGSPEKEPTKPIPEIPQSILDIFEEDVDEDSFYSRFTDDQLSRLSINFADYVNIPCVSEYRQHRAFQIN